MPLRLGEEIQEVLRRGDGELKDSRAATRSAGRKRARDEGWGMAQRGRIPLTNQVPNKSARTEERLQGMFERYNRKYWKGQLPAYRLAISVMPDAVGRCNWRRKVITINVEAHKSDREIRSTVLHEMAHAAASIRGSHGHDPEFFAQVECCYAGKL
jgi:hypothetical protein